VFDKQFSVSLKPLTMKRSKTYKGYSIGQVAQTTAVHYDYSDKIEVGTKFTIIDFPPKVRITGADRSANFVYGKVLDGTNYVRININEISQA